MTLVNLTAPKNKYVEPWIGNIFDSIFNDTIVPNHFSNPLPSVNIAETALGYEIDMPAPGLNKEDLKINLTKRELSIAVKNTENSKEKGKKSNKQKLHYPPI